MNRDRSEKMSKEELKEIRREIYKGYRHIPASVKTKEERKQEIELLKELYKESK